MVESEKAQAIAVTLYPQDIKIVDGADTYDAGRSATLRRIIREWNDWRQHMLIDTGAEYRTEHPTQYITAQIPEE